MIEMAVLVRQARSRGKSRACYRRLSISQWLRNSGENCSAAVYEEPIDVIA